MNYEKRPSLINLAEYLQSSYIDHGSYEIMTAIKTVDNLYPLGFIVSCLIRF